MTLPFDLQIVGPDRLSPSDVTLATTLIARCREVDGVAVPFDVETDVDDGSMRYCLAWRNDRLVGIASIQGNEDVEVSLAVDPQERRQSIGRVLVDQVRKSLKAAGLAEILLVTDEASTSGRAFVAATGARYKESEYRMLLDRSAVPSGRDWPEQVELRQGSTGDATLISGIVAEAFGDSEDGVAPWIEHALTLENHRFFVATLNGVPIGNIRTNYYGANIYITAFAVVPAYRRRGYGRQVLLRTIDRLIEEKWPTILIEVATHNRNALGLYLSCGFHEQTSYGYYELVI